jgi:urease accessory protein
MSNDHQGPATLTHPGKFAERDMPDFSGRDWNERAFTIGIGG